MSKELDLKIQSGPCIGCGEVNYPLSMGGPNICPACNCGTDLKTRLQPYRTHIKLLQAENEKLKKENRWIPVSERLPEKELLNSRFSEYVLCCNANIGGAWCDQINIITKFWRGANNPYPTHWKPIILPEQAPT